MEIIQQVNQVVLPITFYSVRRDIEARLMNEDYPGNRFERLLIRLHAYANDEERLRAMRSEGLRLKGNFMRGSS